MHQNNLRLAKRLLFLCAALLCVVASPAQASDTTSKASAATLADAFGHGSVSGKFRYYFMSTVNKGSLDDYYAHAAGGYIKYATQAFHGFRLAVGSSFTFNLGSSDFAIHDPKTGTTSRYEIALFDLSDHTNRFNMARLDELHLSYDLGGLFKDSAGGGWITLGKQAVNTPFINEQDGRMRPTLVDAVWLRYNKRKFGIEGGWIYGILPRGYQQWFSVGHSMGLFGQGVNPDGTRSNYRYNVHTDGIAVLGLSYNSNRMKVAFWEQYVENVFNTLMLQPEYKILNKNRTTVTLGTQLIRQDVVNDGGNEDTTKAYATKNAGNWTSSSKVELGRVGGDGNVWLISLNYTRIGSSHRFMAPREWGREPFYTFLPRERTESTGDTHAFVVKSSKEFCKRKLAAELAAGYMNMADLLDYGMNKYGLVSYAHYCTRLDYTFDKTLKGFNVDLLYVYKKRVGDVYGSERALVNKVDMSQIDFRINYSF